MNGLVPKRAPGLTFLGAAVWSIGATALLHFILLSTFALRPNAGLDIVAGVACQAAAYLFALFLFIRVYEPNRGLGEIIGARSADASLLALSLALGVALQFPASGLATLIEQVWPHSQAELLARAQQFEAITPWRQVAVVAGVVFIGPLVEELFFRGALYRGLRQRHTAGMATIGVAAFFAAAHQDGRVFLPILLAGLAMTHLRAISGSILPPLVLHAAFNATSIVPTLGKPVEVEDLTATLSPPLLLVGTAASAGLLVLARAVAIRSPRALVARRQDGEG